MELCFNATIQVDVEQLLEILSNLGKKFKTLYRALSFSATKFCHIRFTVMRISIKSRDALRFLKSVFAICYARRDLMSMCA